MGVVGGVFIGAAVATWGCTVYFSVVISKYAPPPTGYVPVQRDARLGDIGIQFSRTLNPVAGRSSSSEEVPAVGDRHVLEWLIPPARRVPLVADRDVARDMRRARVVAVRVGTAGGMDSSARGEHAFFARHFEQYGGGRWTSEEGPEVVSMPWGPQSRVFPTGERLGVTVTRVLPSVRAKALDWRPDGCGWLAVALFDGSLWVHDMAGAREPWCVQEAMDRPRRCVRWMRLDDRWCLVSGTDDLMLWLHTTDGYGVAELREAWPGHDDFIRGLSVHPRRPWLLSCGDDRLVHLWGMGGAQVERLASFDGGAHYTMSVSWMKDVEDPHRFAAASLDGSVSVWEVPGASLPCGFVASRRRVSSWRAHTSGVNSETWWGSRVVASSSDDQCVAMAAVEASPLLPRGAVLRRHAHHHNVSCVRVLEDLQVVLSGGEDGMLVATNLEDGSAAATIGFCDLDTYRDPDAALLLRRIWALEVAPSAGRGVFGETRLVAVAQDHGVVVVRVENAPFWWSPERHHLFPVRVREAIRCVLTMRLWDREQEVPRYPDALWWKLPLELVFKVFEFVAS